MTNLSVALLRRFERAAVNKSWKGGKDPADWEEIENEYTFARQLLVAHIEQLEKQASAK